MSKPTKDKGDEKPTVPAALSKYLSKIGAKGGATSGASKLRGGPEYYKAISAKAVASRKKKAVAAAKAEKAATKAAKAAAKVKP